MKHVHVEDLKKLVDRWREIAEESPYPIISSTLRGCATELEKAAEADARDCDG